MIGHDDDVAGEHDLEAAADGSPVDGGYDRLLEVPELRNAGEAARALPCIPADGPGAAEGEQREIAPGAPPCEEVDPGELPEELAADPEMFGEDEPVVEATADEVFTPDDEISEDYPVPLPADI